MKKFLFVLLFCFTSQAQVGTNNEIFNFPLDCNVMLDRVRSAETTYYYMLNHRSSRSSHYIKSNITAQDALEILNRLQRIYGRNCHDHQQEDTQ